MACSMSSTSWLRTSPSSTRSGRIRRALRIRSRAVTSPRPSTLGGRVSRRTTCSWPSCNSAASSMVTRRSYGEMLRLSTLSNVVLPAPVPPLIRMLQRRWTAPSRNTSISSLKVPDASRSVACSGSLRNLRIDRQGPSSASGGMMALTRLPSGRRASTIGLDSSMRRPSGARMRRMTRSTCSSSMKRMSVLLRMPLRST